MRGALDRDVGAEEAAEQIELGTAQSGARAGGVGDGAVVLDQEHRAVGLRLGLGEVALGRAAGGQRSDPCQHVTPASSADRTLVVGELGGGAGIEHRIERLRTERATHGVEQVDREIAMAVGKHRGGECGEAPRDGRPAATGRHRRGPFDEAARLHRLEVLADRGVGEAELGGELGCGRRVGALQPTEQATLCLAEVGRRARTGGGAGPGLGARLLRRRTHPRSVPRISEPWS